MKRQRCESSEASETLPGVRSFVCDVCGRRTANQDRLKQHVAAKHKKRLATTTATTTTTSAPSTDAAANVTPRTVPPVVWRILVVGDGNLSYSRALCRCAGRRVPLSLTATTFDSRDALFAKYPESRGIVENLEQRRLVEHVLHGVDASRLHVASNALESVQPFDRIVFNFPHSGEDLLQRNRALVAHYLHSACSRLANKDEGTVHLTLCEHQVRDWGIASIAAHLGLVVVSQGTPSFDRLIHGGTQGHAESTESQSEAHWAEAYGYELRRHQVGKRFPAERHIETVFRCGSAQPAKCSGALCSICLWDFAGDTDALQAHEEGGVGTTDKASVSAEERERERRYAGAPVDAPALALQPLCCHVCERVFTTQRALQQHLDGFVSRTLDEHQKHNRCVCPKPPAPSPDQSLCRGCGKRCRFPIKELKS